ncbi:MAG: hypothetical protein LUE21_10385 [Oscillospiraceae bacterium]|nr:hypothetical protein [Oscillospiraceae bacterium]
MKRPLRFDTPRHVRETLAKIGNELRRGEMTPQTANALVCVCNSVLSCFKTFELEAKIDELAKILEDYGKKE